jgi:hypothetical protein
MLPGCTQLLRPAQRAELPAAWHWPPRSCPWWTACAAAGQCHRTCRLPRLMATGFAAWLKLLEPVLRPSMAELLEDRAMVQGAAHSKASGCLGATAWEIARMETVRLEPIAACTSES